MNPSYKSAQSVEMLIHLLECHQPERQILMSLGRSARYNPYSEAWHNSTIEQAEYLKDESHQSDHESEWLTIEKIRNRG